MHNERHQTTSRDYTKKPILSLILPSRNDQYMGNSLWRLETTLNYVAQNVHELDRDEDVEVIVADWGSEIPLQTVLHLSPVAARIVSFIIIPPALAHEVQKDSQFSEVHALNAAARRANGEYIGRIAADILVGKRFLNTFFELCEGTRELDIPLASALLLSNRRQIPYRFAVRCPSYWEVDRYIRWFGRYLGGEMYHLPLHLFYQSYIGIWLLHRDVWNECGGFDEHFIYYNWMEVDMILRLMQRNYTVVDLGKLVDYDFYHLEHLNPRAHWLTYSDRKLNPTIDLTNQPKDLEFYPNSENWGLMKHPLKVVSYSTRQNNVVTEMLAQPRYKWLAFIYLLLSSGTQIVWDYLIVALRSTLIGLVKLLLSFSPVWQQRARVAWETVRGQPLTRWPGLLISLWTERKSHHW